MSQLQNQRFGLKAKDGTSLAHGIAKRPLDAQALHSKGREQTINTLDNMSHKGA